jgi:hypothetical protein
MDAFFFRFAAIGSLILIAVVGCASPDNRADVRESARRKTVPNLDRHYDWGATPAPGPAPTHVPD